MAMAAVLESLPSTSSCTLELRPGHEVLAEIARNHDAHQDGVAVDATLDLAVIVRRSGHVEEARSLELARQAAAGGGAVLVVNQDRDVVHVQAEREPVEQQHHGRHGQRQAQAALVANDMAQFLDKHRSRAPVAHAAFLSSASIKATNTSSREGWICSSRRMAMPLAASAARMRSMAA